MTDKSTSTDNLTETLASLSEVTPKKTKKWRLGSGFFIGLVVCTVLLSFAFTPHSAKKVTAADDSTTEGGTETLTLSQNLALIEAMKHQSQQAAQTALLPSNSVHRVAAKPSALRPKNQLSKEVLARMNAPTTFLNTAASSQLANNSPANATATAGYINGNSPDAQFMNQASDITTVSAQRLAHPEYTVPAGELIAATLETAINPELPNLVRAITTHDTYSLRGQHRLIPRGSTLLGQYNAQLVEGQTRILVIWTQVQLATGVKVTLNSPSTDRIGRGGQAADYINHHFFERFGTSALLTILGGYSANSGVHGQDQYNSEAQYRMALSSSFQQSSGQQLERYQGIKTTLQVNQGADINIFVAHDLDFYAVRRSL